MRSLKETQANTTVIEKSHLRPRLRQTGAIKRRYKWKLRILEPTRCSGLSQLHSFVAVHAMKNIVLYPFLLCLVYVDDRKNEVRVVVLMGRGEWVQWCPSFGIEKMREENY